MFGHTSPSIITNPNNISGLNQNDMQAPEAFETTGADPMNGLEATVFFL